MWLVVGLGNPGSEYALTRHNVGFMAIDAFISGLRLSAKGGSGNQSAPEKEQFKGLATKFKIEDQDVLFLKPQTFMNLSGESVRPAMDFYKIPMNQVIVLHDEVDLPFAGMKIQKDRGPGGHNGIKSISQHLGSNDYIRVRMGVGKPGHPEMKMVDHVLGRFNQEEMKALPEFMQKTWDAVETIIFDGYQKAATKFNG